MVYSRAHSIEPNPQPAVNSFEVSAQPFYMAFKFAIGYANSPPQIGQPIHI